MKTLKLFALLLSVVFSMGIEAQTSDTTLFTGVDIDGRSNGPAYVVHNNNYGAIAGDSIGHDQYGKVKIFDIHTHTVLQSFEITPNASGNTWIDMRKPAITPNGDVYVLYTYGTTGNQNDIRLEKLSLDGTRITIMEFRDGGGPIWYLGDKLYCQMGASQYGFDPRNSGLPNLNPYDMCFFAIDGNTNNIVFANVNSFTEEIGEMLLMPNGNIAGKVRPGETGEGNLYEFDANTGVELGLIRSGNPYGREKFGTNGDLEVFDNDLGKFLVYSQSSGWASVVKETDLPSGENLFRLPLKDWEFNGNEFHGIYDQHFMFLSENLVHGSLTMTLPNLIPSIKMWFNGDGTHTLIYMDNNTVHMLKINNPQLDTSLIPTVHIGGNIVDGRNGEIYDNGWQSADPHILTLVMDDANMPTVNSNPNQSWINLPNGYTYGGAFPIRNEGGTLVYDALCYHDANHKEWVHVYIKPASEVLGVQENTLSDFKVWPNPATDYIKFSVGKDISQVKIFDINGRCVLQQNAIGNQGVFVGDLSPGIYLVRIQAGKQTGSRKWVKW